MDDFHSLIHIIDGLESGSSVALLGTLIDVVAPSSGRRHLIFTLDDGTATLQCVLFPREGEEDVKLKIGMDVHVCGTVTLFRDQVQLRVDRLKRVLDPNYLAVWTNTVVYWRQRKDLLRVQNG